VTTAARGPRGRYAPSPTGRLHLGNLRTALLAWLMARHQGGSFILRIEDLDLPRVRPDSTSSIIADLNWLRLNWDEGPDIGGMVGPYFQSARQEIYRAALARLSSKGLVYPCYCTRSELAGIASAPHGGEDGPRYPGTCRALTGRQQRRYEAQGRRAALRFRAPAEDLSFEDRLAGHQEDSVAERCGDFVVWRSDGIVSYQLAVVVDDALMGVTQVVRGADLLPSTLRQLALCNALDYPAPTEFAHVPLLVDTTGARMAKREPGGTLTHGLDSLRSQGISPGKVLGLLATSAGLTTASEDEIADPADLLTTFDESRLYRYPTPWLPLDGGDGRRRRRSRGVR
jgi:glutamyl-tRNA synthetase